MQPTRRITITITFIEQEADKVLAFRSSHLKTTHKEVYFRGIEGVETDKLVSRDLKRKAKRIIS